MFEQEQALGFSSVSTNIRMTVIKLKSGGLWVHAPIAPTKECIQVQKQPKLDSLLYDYYLRRIVEMKNYHTLFTLIFNTWCLIKLLYLIKREHTFGLVLQMIECFAFFLWQLIKELGAPVEYIVLPTFAYEHKIFVGPFSRKFPKAQVWVAPRQWSWPLNLPLEFFGIFRAKIIKDGDLSTPWAEEIEQKVLSSPEVGMFF